MKHEEEERLRIENMPISKPLTEYVLHRSGQSVLRVLNEQNSSVSTKLYVSSLALRCLMKYRIEMPHKITPKLMFVVDTPIQYFAEAMAITSVIMLKVMK